MGGNKLLCYVIITEPPPPPKSDEWGKEGGEPENCQRHDLLTWGSECAHAPPAMGRVDASFPHIKLEGLQENNL